MRLNQERIAEKRNEVIQEHAEMATETHTVWHARDRDSVHPPCVEMLEHLKKTRLSTLRSRNVGAVIIVRAVEKPLQLGALFPIMNVVEDVTSDVSHMEIFFPTTSPPLAILKQGTVLAIKEPLCAMNHGRKVIRVIQPSNIVVLKPEHYMYPKIFRDALVSSNSRMPRTEGDTASGRGEYTEAIDWYGYSLSTDAYTRGLRQLPKDEIDLRQALCYSRANAAMHAGQYELALEDAKLSVLDVSHSDYQQALYVAGSAAYQLRQFALADGFFQRVLSVCPADIQSAKYLRKTRERLREESIGAFDFTAMLEQQTLADHANFINKTEIRESTDRGRGVFAKDDISCGELIFCEKAFAISHPSTVSPSNPNLVQNNNYYGGCGKAVAALWLRTVQKLFANPSLAPELLNLYGGASYTDGFVALNVDGNIVLDVFQVLQIIDHNVYSFEAGHAHMPYGTNQHSSNEERESAGLYKHASYVNHGCINNSSRSMTGDIMIVRANQDISKGTEITTSYLTPSVGEPNRNAELKRTWFFDCDCSLCASETACDVNWKQIFDEVRSHRLRKDEYDPAQLQNTIRKAQDLAERLEEHYPESLFGMPKMPRIALRELQGVLMFANERLGCYEKSQEHALGIIRESGYNISSDGSQIQIDYTHGLPTKAVVDALYLLAKQETPRELAEQYLSLAKKMYLVINGTSNGWDVAYGGLDN
ncbi:SET domain-containing protein [Aureobasidium subglaciale]|nr:SET domain-containing protein [Aureobasidium subglaciale]KAI5213635.1 SET domain-containing protein [Aureobasidium subglaciale]KAI5215366.1 SET domain-containing protein [Aureobasidium subglaciale]KAI5253285.1 SET domain-containing protein [Aureobasidium subglaciale]